HARSKVNIRYVDAETIEKEGIGALLKGVDAVLVPGGFGKRGVEGMMKAIQYARENKVPYLGICLGMQLAVIEFARNVVRLATATATKSITSTCSGSRTRACAYPESPSASSCAK